MISHISEFRVRKYADTGGFPLSLTGMCIYAKLYKVMAIDVYKCRIYYVSMRIIKLTFHVVYLSTELQPQPPLSPFHSCKTKSLVATIEQDGGQWNGKVPSWLPTF